MPKVGDRVIVEGVKIGNPRREGTCVKVIGRLLSVRWSDGTTSLFTPGAGSVRFEPGNGSAKAAKKPSKPVAKPVAKAQAKKTPKKAAPKKTGKKR
jgi:hypothetical protein